MIAPKNPPKKNASFADLVAQQIPYLRRNARRYYRDEANQDDLASDVVLKALENQHLFIEGSNLKGWLLTIMYNLFATQYRVGKRKGVSVQIDELLVDTGVTNFSTPNHGPSLLATEEMQHMLSQLKPELLVIVESRINGMKYEEIAAQLNIPCGTVKNRLHKARKALMVEA